MTFIDKKLRFKFVYEYLEITRNWNGVFFYLYLFLYFFSTWARNLLV